MLSQLGMLLAYHKDTALTYCADETWYRMCATMQTYGGKQRHEQNMSTKTCSNLAWRTRSVTHGVSEYTCAGMCQTYMLLLDPHGASCGCIHNQVKGKFSRCSREADLVELDSPPDCLGEAHSQGPHLLGQPPRLPLKVFGNVLSGRLQLLLVELLGHWLSIVLNLQPGRISCKAFCGWELQDTRQTRDPAKIGCVSMPCLPSDFPGSQVHAGTIH